MIILIGLVILVIILLLVSCKESMRDMYWVDDDIAMRSPNPYYVLYWGDQQDDTMMTPRDYYLQNMMYSQQGIIPKPRGWDMFRPAYHYSPGYAMIGYV